MSRFKALLWKEWGEIRVFLGIALFVFLGLPLLGGLEGRVQSGQFEIMASAWVYYLGGVFAVFVGVGTVVRDLKGRLEDFWRSRPIGLGRWILIKYFVGLAVVLVTLCAPLTLEQWVNHSDGALFMAPRLLLAWYPFVWAVLYSVGFVMACLVRRGAHAAMLSLAVMLLLYFLPEVIPPLHHLSVSWAVEESAVPRLDANYNLVPGYYRIPWTVGHVVFRPEQLEFAAGMLVLCAVALAGALVIVRRDVRVESGRKTIYWSIGGAALILLVSASFQVATNLQILQRVKLPDRDWIQMAFGDADHAVLFTQRWEPAGSSDVPKYRAYPFKVTSAGIELGQATELGSNFWWSFMLWQPQRPDVLYGLRFGPEGSYLDEHYPVLMTAQLGIPVAKVTEQPFPKLLTRDTAGVYSSKLYSAGDRLYVLFGPHALVFDIADPLNPKLVSESTIDQAYAGFDPWFDSTTSDVVTIPLPQVPGLSPRQRLEARLGRWTNFDGAALTHVHGQQLYTFVIDKLTDTSVTFRRVGRYEPTPVQKLFDDDWGGAASKDGLYYQSFRTSSGMGGGFRLTVFDVGDPQRPHPIAHVASPADNFERRILPFADGKFAICGQSEVWLISAPPLRK